MPTIKIIPMPGKSIPGEKGDPGPRGYQGDQGFPGLNGASAYEIAVQNGFVGTEQQWLDSLNGNANTGDFTFTESTLNTTGDMTIGVTGVPGQINLSAYAGVNIQTSAEFGLYVNGVIPENKVITQSDLVTTLSGATGSFVSNDNKTVTVVNGIITSIEEII